MYNEGISLPGDTLDTGVLYGVLTKSGNSYSYKDTKLGVGRRTRKASSAQIAISSKTSAKTSGPCLPNRREQTQTRPQNRAKETQKRPQ